MTDGQSRLAQLADDETGPLLYHTARNMHARQLLGIADRKLRHLLVPSLPVDFDARYEQSVPDDLDSNATPLRENATLLRGTLDEGTRRTYRERLPGLSDGDVTLIGRTLSVRGRDDITWTGPPVTDPPAMWALKFQGFEFLSWPVLAYDDPDRCPVSVEALGEWIRDWARSHETRIGAPAYLRRAWTPHAVCLRLINWGRFAAWADLDERDPELAATLRRLAFKNASFLSAHVEHDVGGNHLIENGAALVVAGIYLDVARWVRQGLSVLVDAADQFLADGGHFERSPMYHVLTVTRYLTVLDLLSRVDREVPAAVARVARGGVAFLRAIEPPDGRLPLLNDSVHGESLTLPECRGYASAVGVDAATLDGATVAPPDVDRATTQSGGDVSPSVTSDGGAATRDPAGLDAAGELPRVEALEASGYYWLDTESGRAFLDGGAIGPAHLPAHSHNDHFSILLWIDGHPVATDTGTPVYAPTDDRQYARSVAAHNTVQYGDTEPIDVGGSYLFGRRIEPEVAIASTDEFAVLDGRYRRADGSYAHRRRVVAAADWWLIWDDITANAPAPVRSRLHLDPAVSVSDPRDRAQLDLRHEAAGPDPLVRVTPLGVGTTTVARSPYFPTFGTRTERSSIAFQTRGADVSFGYLIAPDRREPVAVDRTASGLVVSMDDRTYEVPNPDR